jgi:hypothetical protein
MTLKYFKKTTLLSSVIISLFSLVNTTWAGVAKIPGGNCTTWGIKCTGNDAPSDIVSYMWAGINVVLAFLAIVAAAALVYNGIMYIISRGEDDKIRQAKTGIVYSVLGIFVVGLAAWIVNAIINLTP